LRIKLAFTFLFLLLSLTSTLLVNAKTKVYRYTDEDGSVSYTDRPTHSGYVKVIETRKGWVEAKPSGNFKNNKTRYLPIISEIARKNEIPVSLVSAIVHAESHYNPTVVSRTGAVGLMQLMPDTARRYNVANRENPHQNVTGGVAYFKDLMKLFNNDLDLSLAAYNAGENAVIRYGNKIPPYKETQRYVQKVRALYVQYQDGSL